MAKTKKTKINNIKTTYRYKEMLRILDKAEYQIVDMITLSKTADYIAWLGKFKKVPIEEVHELADRMTNIFNMQKEF